PRSPFSIRVTHEAATSSSSLTVLAVSPVEVRSSRSRCPNSMRLHVGVCDGTGAPLFVIRHLLPGRSTGAILRQYCLRVLPKRLVPWIVVVSPRTRDPKLRLEVLE